VREVRDARVGAEHAQQQLDGAEHDHERACLHRDRRDQQHQLAVGKQHAVGQQQAVDTTRRAHGGIDALPGDARGGHQQLHQSGTGDAGDEVGEEAFRAPGFLERGTEHVQRERIEEQMAEAAVQEPVGEYLPGQETDKAAVADRVFAQRPQRQVTHHFFGQKVLQQESRAHGPKQAGGDRWHAHAWRFRVDVGVS
jgi:hypothetical protein